MRGVLHHGTSQADRIFRAGDTSNSTGSACFAGHNRGIELDVSLGRENRAATGVEMRIIFQHANRRFDG